MNIPAFATRPWFRVLAGGVAGGVLSLPLLTRDLWIDQGMYATVADTMLSGGVAYRDAWEMRPPGGFFAFYLAFLLFGRSIAAIHVLEILSLAAACAGLVHLGERRWNSRAGGLWAALLLPFLVLPFGPNSAEPEAFQLPLLVWAWALWPVERDGERLWGRCLGAGLLLSGVLLLKTTALAWVAVFLVDRLIADARRPGALDKLRWTTVTAAAIALPWLAMLAYYTLRGAFAPLWDALVAAPRGYVASSLARPLADQARDTWNQVHWVINPLEWAMIAAGLVLAWRAGRTEALRWIALLAAAIAIPALQGKHWGYHYLVLAPFAATAPILAGIPFSDPVTVSKAAARFRKALALLPALAIAWRAPASFDSWSALRTPATDAAAPEIPGFGQPWPSARTVGRHLRSSTSPEDRVFIWGDSALVYFFADRRLAGRYPLLIHVMAPWFGPDRLTSLVESLDRERPKAILVGPERMWWYRHPWWPSGEILDQEPSMTRFLRTNYRRGETVEGYEFWWRAD